MSDVSDLLAFIDLLQNGNTDWAGLQAAQFSQNSNLAPREHRRVPLAEVKRLRLVAQRLKAENAKWPDPGRISHG